MLEHELNLWGKSNQKSKYPITLFNICITIKLLHTLTETHASKFHELP